MKLFRTKPKDISDQELIKGCLEGKRDMQRLLYERYAAPMKGVCLRYVRTSFEAEDVLHDAFMKVYNNLAKFRYDCPLDAWVRRIVVNTALSHHRNKLQKLETVESENLEMLLEPEISDSDQSAEDLLELIQQLPEKYRLVFNLHAIEGYSHKEAGEMLQQPEATTRSQYLRARTMLKEMIDKEYQRYNETVRS